MAYSKKDWVTGDTITASDMNRLEEGVNSCQSMFNYKGNCLFAELPTSGNAVNDTYYVKDKECGYTWNGSEWSQSGAYGVSINELNGDINQLSNEIINLKEVYNVNLFTFSSGYSYFNHNFIKNHTYRIENNCDEMVSMAIVDENNEVVETITNGALANIIFEYTPTNNATKLRIYTQGNGTIIIEDLNSYVHMNDKRVESLENKIVIGENKFNKYETVDGYFLNYVNGSKNVNENFCYSSFYTEIKPNTNYIQSQYNSHICFYDKDKNFISGTIDKTFTTPENAMYLRASCSISIKDTYYIFEGNEPKSYKPFEYRFIYQNNENVNVVIVDKNGSGKYTSITQASANEPSGTIIYVMPGVYDNEEIRGTYSKKQYIIGVSAQDCIIKNHTGKYLYEPIQIGAGLLKNLTFVAEKGVDVSESDFNYAIHVESHLLSNENLTIENCIAISHNSSAFGMGMRGGCNVIIKNSTFISTTSSGFLVHDSNYDDYLGEQNLSIQDCVIYAKDNDSSAIKFQSQEKNGSTINIEMIRNSLKSTHGDIYKAVNYYGGSGGSDDFLGCINFRLKETSWGNSDNTFDSN